MSKKVNQSAGEPGTERLGRISTLPVPAQTGHVLPSRHSQPNPSQAVQTVIGSSALVSAAFMTCSVVL
jgi:hypothetical protein